jgi:hypothetical protein
MYGLMVQVFDTGNLEQLRKVVSDCSIARFEILNMTYTASVDNHPHLVYWFMATYPLIFNLQETLSIMGVYMEYYYNTSGWNIIFGRLPAKYYNRVATNYTRRIARNIYKVHNKWYLNYVQKSIVKLYIESEYLV